MDEARLQQYWRIIGRWWWLAVASMLIAGTSAYIGVRRAPRIYRATATVMVGQSLESLNPTSQDLWIGEQLTQTYAQMIRRESLLTAAARELGLAEVPSPDDVTARQVAGTQLLEISVLDTNPERARALADALANQLILLTPAARELTEREAFVQEQLDGLEAQITAVREEIEQERARYEAATSARAVQQHQANLDALQARLSFHQTSYASLLANTQGAVNRVTLVEPALLPTQPVGPSVMRNVLLAMSIGLALAATGALVTELLDKRLRSAREAVQITGLPLLAAIDSLPEARKQGSLVTVYDPRSAASESFRMLANRISLEAAEGSLATAMIASPGPGEGKTLTLANLAVSFAQTGLQVLIVDSDLRRPSQHRLFGLHNDIGFADLLRDHSADLSKLVQTTSVPGLSLLAAGETASSPQSPLGSHHLSDEVKVLLQEAYREVHNLLTPEHIRRAIEELVKHYDLVLFDSPPPTIFSDAAILGPHVDAVLLLADMSLTQRALLAQIADDFRHSGAKLIGLILNRTAEGSISSRQGYYRYYYEKRDGHRHPLARYTAALSAGDSAQRPSVEDSGSKERDGRRPRLLGWGQRRGKAAPGSALNHTVPDRGARDNDRAEAEAP